MEALLFSSPVESVIKCKMMHVQKTRTGFNRLRKPLVVCLDLGSFRGYPYYRFSVNTWAQMNLCVYDVTMDTDNTIRCLERADAVYIPGGNTFLHNALAKYYRNKKGQSVFDALKKKCSDSNFLYMGSSAGAIMGCPDIDIARFADPDMIGDEHLDGLNIVDFYIKPHFDGWIKDVPTFKNFAKMSQKTVIGLYEGSYVEVSGKNVEIHGKYHCIDGGSAVFVENA